MGSINLKFFEEGSKGLVERQASFNASIESGRDMSGDNAFAREISAKLAPIMSIQSAISERVYEIGKQFAEPGKAKNIRM